MLIRYLHLAILAATAFSQRTPTSGNSNDMDRQLGDFTWDIAPEDGYPIIGFSNSTEQGEVVFKYNFTGTLSDQKYLDVKLYQNDCVSAADQSLAFTNSTSGDELDVDVDIIQETIKKSVHYQDLNGTAAIIGFCLRVDYNYVDNDGNTEVVMFYETNVTINVDLTANFTLTELILDKRLASGDAVEAELDYGVEAYYCLEDGTEVEPEALGRGSALLFCVRTDANATTDIMVADILSMTISQPGGSASGTTSIVNGVSDPLTDTVCEGGICSVKSQLSSKFFARVIPDTIATEPDGGGVVSGGGGGGGGYTGEIVEDSPIEGGVSVGGGNMVASGGDPGGGCENPEEMYTYPDSQGVYDGINKITIEIHYDDYPQESGWTITRSPRTDTSDLYITGLCTGFFSTQDIIVANTVYVSDGEYLFTMTDSYGDGLCCGYGEGYFNIYVNDVKVENDITFDFTYSAELYFDASGARRLDAPIRRLEDDIPILQVEGVALLAFGRRRLRAPIRGLLTSDRVKAFMAAQQQENDGKEIVVATSAQRMLQDGAAESGFGLQINLKDDLVDESDSQGTGSGSQMAVAVLVLIVLAGVCGLGFIFFTRRVRKEDKEEDIVKHHSSATSVDTYASQCSANSHSDYEYPSDRGRRRIT